MIATGEPVQDIVHRRLLAPEANLVALRDAWCREIKRQLGRRWHEQPRSRWCRIRRRDLAASVPALLQEDQRLIVAAIRDGLGRHQTKIAGIANGNDQPLPVRFDIFEWHAIRPKD